MLDKLIIRGAREHNLKNIDLDIPKNKLVVFTGVSGSGKTSLAFDTIYAEGQRRYVESLSAYARQFLGVMTRPDVDSIEGLSPAICISQKTVSHNPRSTVGTVTEIYDYLRLLFARIGHPHCPKCGQEIQRQSVDQIVATILSLDLKRVMILAPVVKDRKGEFAQLFENFRKQGFSRVRVDGEVKAVESDFVLLKNNKHTIEVVVDRLVFNKKEDAEKLRGRLTQSLETALHLTEGTVIAAEVLDKTFDFPENPKKIKEHLFSERFACPACNISLPEIAPRTFSFNSPHGACSTCTGLGSQLKIDPNLIINPNLSISEGAIFPWAKMIENDGWMNKLLIKVSEALRFDLNVPLGKLTLDDQKSIIYGTGHQIYTIKYRNRFGLLRTYDTPYEGVIPNLERRYKETDSDYIRMEIEKYMTREPCPACHGARLKPEALTITIAGKNIIQVTDLSISDSLNWIENLDQAADLKSNSREHQVAQPITNEVKTRLNFLLSVGLDYITLGRAASTLAGGESQRIQLASQIGSGLSGVLYVLDEPSIGLHARDQQRLINTLKKLRDLGNTVIVVEHDAQTMLQSDYLFDFGPGAGERGGEVVAAGTPAEVIANPKSLTGKYLSGKLKVGELKKDNVSLGEFSNPALGTDLAIVGCRGHNLKNLDVTFPLGKLICVTGVSGSGKSSLIGETLYRALRQEFGLKLTEKPLEFDGLLGLENIDKVIDIDQSPIGRTPRSNPATYTKAFDAIREIFSLTKEAQVRGYTPGRFSFNVKGGRCEACEGDGQIKIEMQFMPDVYVDCEICGGKRYNHEALEIEYKDKNISQVLEMTVSEALKFFENIPQISRKLETLEDVGLGYIKLGQPAPTLSGGEAQRVKLATELSKKSTGKTLYLLDEPTTGLHFADLENLIHVLKRLVRQGNTVVVIEHNLDIIKNADWVIDLGPEGGDRGGKLLAAGTPTDVAACAQSYTGQALRPILKGPLLPPTKTD
ncbi:MAG: excinuclease ABC subunit UvrA [bacterium]|nr:excinuclease ABC subunit UvrA [bacterium]